MNLIANIINFNLNINLISTVIPTRLVVLQLLYRINLNKIPALLRNSKYSGLVLSDTNNFRDNVDDFLTEHLIIVFFVVAVEPGESIGQGDLFVYERLVGEDVFRALEVLLHVLPNLHH